MMATLTARGTEGLIELRFEIDPRASGRDWLVLRGRGALGPRAFGMGKRASILYPKLQLALTVRARRAGTHTSPERPERERTRTTSMPG